jgi:hypothetical protein
MNTLKLIGGVVTLSGLWFYSRHLFNQGAPSDFFSTIAGASIALAGIWLLLWPVSTNRKKRQQKKCA